MSQTQFGEIGGVTKKTQMLYESGERLPDAAYLRAVMQIGVDAQYVLSGVRSKNLDELMLSEEFVAETVQELRRGKTISGLPLAPQVPVVRAAHKFVSRMIVLMATGQLREEDIDVLDGLAERLAKPPEEIPAATTPKTELAQPKTAEILDTEYKSQRTGPNILSTEYTEPRTGPQVVGQGSKTTSKKNKKDEAP